MRFDEVAVFGQVQPVLAEEVARARTSIRSMGGLLGWADG
jgi:hypothetical protein